MGFGPCGAARGWRLRVAFHHRKRGAQAKWRISIEPIDAVDGFPHVQRLDIPGRAGMLPPLPGKNTTQETT